MTPFMYSESTLPLTDNKGERISVQNYFIFFFFLKKQLIMRSAEVPM